MEALGYTLDSVLRKSENNQLSRIKCFDIALQLLDRIENLHSLGYVHGDLKPSNLMFYPNQSQRLCLIDFGLSTRYVTKDNIHISLQNTNLFSGNIQFASRHTCKGFNKSRRDDYESLFYILLYLLTEANLPWSYLVRKNNHKSSLSKNLQDRLSFCEREYAKMLPKILNSHFLLALKLEFTEKPKY